MKLVFRDNEMERVELKLLGITRNQLQSNVFAMLLEQADGKLRLPIVLGVAEAQSIAVKLEGVVPPRPLTHDLMVSVFHRFGIFPDFVEIYSFRDGVFASHIHLTGADGTVHELDARTSDAVALAVRVGCPIYTSRDILERAGFVPDDDGVPLERGQALPLQQMTIEQLQQQLQCCIDEENYERAAEIQKVLQQKLRQS